MESLPCRIAPLIVFNSYDSFTLCGVGYYNYGEALKPRCTLCNLHKTCQNIKIDGRGDEKPKYLFVGQAPGAEEDNRNRVFIGPSGQLLLNAIKEFGLTPARLTNSVRCFPPGDREPNPAEITACKPFLMDEILQVKPEIIVACGNVALRTLTGKNGITKYAGSVVGSIGTSKIFAILHPSYILRVPKDSHKWEMQLKTLKNMGVGRGKQRVEYEIIPAERMYEMLFERIKTGVRNGYITFDFETTGKYKQFGGEIRCCGFRIDTRNYIVEAKDSWFEKLMELFAGEHLIKKCAHNSIFERRWILDKYGIETQSLFYDPMLLHYLLDENKSHSLESVTFELLDRVKVDFERFMQENSWDWGTVPFDYLAQHCAEDIECTDLVMGKLVERLKSHPEIRPVYEDILLPLSSLCASLEHRGMKIDKDWALSALELSMDESSSVFDEMMALPKLGLGKDFNPASTKQVSHILFDVLQLKTKIKTEKGDPSTNADSLELMKGKHKFVDLLLEFRKIVSVQDSFLTKFPDMTDSYDLIHPNFNPAFQVTGRISVKDPPAANMPRDPEVRGIVVSRFLDGKILSLDYKQLEMRLSASEAGEENMLKIFREGGDVHGETARKMFGKGFTKEQRDISKNINFGTIYGISAYSLSLKFQIPKKIAQEHLDEHYKTFPKIYEWMAAQHRFIKRNGWISSRFGRIRRLPEAIHADDYELARLFRQAGNFPIQSAGADITSLASIKINEKLIAMKAKSLLFHQVHDSILIDCYPGEGEGIQEISERIMTKEIPSRCEWLKVKLPVDCTVSKRWGGLE